MKPLTCEQKLLTVFVTTTKSDDVSGVLGDQHCTVEQGRDIVTRWVTSQRPGVTFEVTTLYPCYRTLALAVYQLLSFRDSGDIHVARDFAPETKVVLHQRAHRPLATAHAPTL
mgnify:CR=1 FL=1